MQVQWIDPVTQSITPQTLRRGATGYELVPAQATPPDSGTLYLSPPWIDSHCHVFHGVNFGISPDEIGYKAGVHLLVDAGSAGVETLHAFAEYIVAPARTKILAFLNVSAIGLVTMQEYHDMRQVRAEDAADAVLAHASILRGIKVRSSGYVVEDAGIEPLRLAVRAAERAGCPLMVHMGEAPPSNEENLALLRAGDILTHCFHGKQPPQWNAQPLWNPDGTPTPALQAALDRGVLLDVGHGEASFSAQVAGPVVARGFHAFSISTDLHGRSWHDPVHSLAVTMSKFLALGMPLPAVIRSVTETPARRFRLDGWCDAPAQNATLFRLRPVSPMDPPFVDAPRTPIAVRQVIDPVAVLMDGEWIPIDLTVNAP